MKDLFTLFLLVLFVCSTSIAQHITPISDHQQAIMDAERDANLSDTQIWALAGCGFGIWGIAAAYIITPAVPTTKLLGKSPEYIAFYTETYQQKVKAERARQAGLGCLAAGAAYIYFFGVIYPRIN